MITVTIDFDGTLTLPEVQEYVKQLCKDGIDVHIVTSRYDDINAHRYPKNPSNKELWALVDKLGLHPSRVHFMNMNSKGQYLKNTKVRIHLDNDHKDMSDIRTFSHVLVVDVNKHDWQSKIESQINIFKKLL
jgi:hypothetical protein